jgi:hypothetical protein
MSNSVFLCVKQNNYNNNYNCYKFNSFIEADKYYNQHFNTSSTMISVFKYLPTFIQNFLIDYKLKKLFVKSTFITDANLKK